MEPSETPPVPSVVHAAEKKHQQEINKVNYQKRKALKALKEFEAKCPSTKKAKVQVRPCLARKAKDGAYVAYISLVDILKKLPMENDQQKVILMESETVRWREHRTVAFDPKRGASGIIYNPPRQERVFVMQIRQKKTVTVWEDLLVVKASRLPTQSAGLGLFACRAFEEGQVISLYAGVSFEPGKCGLCWRGAGDKQFLTNLFAPSCVM